MQDIGSVLDRMLEDSFSNEMYDGYFYIFLMSKRCSFSFIEIFTIIEFF